MCWVLYALCGSNPPFKCIRKFYVQHFPPVIILFDEHTESILEIKCRRRRATSDAATLCVQTKVVPFFFRAGRMEW